MTTRRERLEARLEKREEWAEKAQRRAEAARQRSNDAVAHIPAGQPVLSGHYSEKRHRRALNRCDSAMRKSIEESKKADHHAAKKRGIEAQLARTIFSDDADAIERLQAKIEKLEAFCARAKEINRAWRQYAKKNDRTPLYKAGLNDERIDRYVEAMRSHPWDKQPIPSYEMTNRRAEIRRAKKRIEEIQARAEKAKRAEQAENGVTVKQTASNWCEVVFAEKPEWEIRNELKKAGFRWRRGSWQGRIDALPECVKELTEYA